MHHSISHILPYFASSHLPRHLQEVSAPFGVLAHQLAERAPANPETTVALRKLLEAKDAAVRAALTAGDSQRQSPSAEAAGQLHEEAQRQSPSAEAAERIYQRVVRDGRRRGMDDESIRQRVCQELEANGLSEFSGSIFGKR